ncbi:uncharacterized protein EV420DRAFT_1474927 [Desarmillaria tabescens]|uniref:Uncharacterized protein n=1 Tax=Armillaria tabescens TaxID=1929756 RepID=A0AA39NI88_ARMTA|nr:uncharacterized protein EV420DRAFT_1474927 [Desarmillaria tabescens]KAK0466132.1 hypothetical protein EV420DRAFT_1474927 [Desarmillaria tabescens]
MPQTRRLPSLLLSIGAENDPDTRLRLISGLWTLGLFQHLKLTRRFLQTDDDVQALEGFLDSTPGLPFAVTTDSILNNEAQLRPHSQLNASAKLAHHATSLSALLACTFTTNPKVVVLVKGSSKTVVGQGVFHKQGLSGTFRMADDDDIEAFEDFLESTPGFVFVDGNAARLSGRMDVGGEKYLSGYWEQSPRDPWLFQDSFTIPPSRRMIYGINEHLMSQ